MKTLTKIEYSNEDNSADDQHTAYVTCANWESWASLVKYIENNTHSINSLSCADEVEDGRVLEIFSSTWCDTKKEFLQDLRAAIKGWKALNK